MSSAYNHPEGGSIELTDTTLTVMAENGHAASIQIGPDGLRDLAKKFKAHAADFEYAMHLEGLSNNEILSSLKPPKPKVVFMTNTKRPTIGTLGDVLKSTADFEPTGCTKITAFSAERWQGVPTGAPDHLEIDMGAATACLNPLDAVTVFISQGTTPEVACSILKAIRHELNKWPCFESVTPLTPCSADEVPF